MAYKIRTTVQTLELKTRALGAHKHPTIPDEVVWQRETIGWFVRFHDSWESLFVGFDKPLDLDPGTEVDIIIQPRNKD